MLAWAADDPVAARRPGRQGSSDARMRSLVLIAARTKVRRRYRDIERWISVEEPDRLQRKSATIDRHYRPVLRTREVGKAQRVPYHDILAINRSTARRIRGQAGLSRVLVREVASRVAL